MVTPTSTCSRCVMDTTAEGIHLDTGCMHALRDRRLTGALRGRRGGRRAGIESLREPSGATEAELQYALDRLGMTRGDLERVLKTPPRTFREYRSYFSIISRMKLPLRVASRLGVFPETTYEKTFKT